MSNRLASTLLLCTWLVLTVPPATAAAPVEPTPFAGLVDVYLDGFGRFHPSIAAGNGLHAHDGELEDFSARSVGEEIRWLHATRARLDAIAADVLSANERLDLRILQGVVDGWLLDLETIKNWSRNPMIYVAAKNLLAMPASEHIVVAPAPAYDLGMASMHSSPPLEARPVQSYYYITDADPAWPLERQNAWLESFNFATLADITAHEVAPGHYVHSVFMRKTPGAPWWVHRQLLLPGDRGAVLE